MANTTRLIFAPLAPILRRLDHLRSDGRNVEIGRDQLQGVVEGFEIAAHLGQALLCAEHFASDGGALFHQPVHKIICHGRAVSDGTWVWRHRARRVGSMCPPLCLPARFIICDTLLRERARASMMLLDRMIVVMVVGDLATVESQLREMPELQGIPMERVDPFANPTGARCKLARSDSGRADPRRNSFLPFIEWRVRDPLPERGERGKSAIHVTGDIVRRAICLDADISTSSAVMHTMPFRARQWCRSRLKRPWDRHAAITRVLARMDSPDPGQFQTGASAETYRSATQHCRP